MQIRQIFYNLLKNKTDYPYFAPLPPFAKAPYLLLKSLERSETPYLDSKLYPYKAMFIIKDLEASHKKLLENLDKLEKIFKALPVKGLEIDSKIEEGALITLHFFYEEK
jgi:hypothetical protein